MDERHILGSDIRMHIRSSSDFSSRLWLPVILLVAFLCAGCSGQAQLAPSAMGTVGSTSSTAPPPAPKLENGDKVKVTVFNEQQLSGEFVVDGTGNIAFPLIGQVPVAGLAGNEVEQRLTERLSGRYLINPKVSVEIMSQRPIYLLGEVGKAGEYPYRPGLNVVSAIALAGGFSPRASTNYVTIRRASGGELKDHPVDPSVIVYPGDMITVQERLF